MFPLMYCFSASIHRIETTINLKTLGFSSIERVLRKSVKYLAFIQPLIESLVIFFLLYNISALHVLLLTKHNVANLRVSNFLSIFCWYSLRLVFFGSNFLKIIELRDINGLLDRVNAITFLGFLEVWVFISHVHRDNSQPTPPSPTDFIHL